mmetsp:Transcript_7834/g.21768  ORF Transcript_7834/g.21768 Transcript_7834/m.21768 type:complete len:217 (-) Transcript_7834:894-1544(-)
MERSAAGPSGHLAPLHRPPVPHRFRPHHLRGPARSQEAPQGVPPPPPGHVDLRFQHESVVLAFHLAHTRGHAQRLCAFRHKRELHGARLFHPVRNCHAPVQCRPGPVLPAHRAVSVEGDESPHGPDGEGPARRAARVGHGHESGLPGTDFAQQRQLVVLDCVGAVVMYWIATQRWCERLRAGQQCVGLPMGLLLRTSVGSDCSLGDGNGIDVGRGP